MMSWLESTNRLFTCLLSLQAERNSSSTTGMRRSAPNDSRPGPIDAVGLSDFGIRQKEMEALKAAGLWELLLRFINGQAISSEVPQQASIEIRQLLQAVALWGEGTKALNDQKPEQALKRFDEAAVLVPSAKIYAMNAVLSLAALQQWDAVDERLSRIYARLAR